MAVRAALMTQPEAPPTVMGRLSWSDSMVRLLPTSPGKPCINTRQRAPTAGQEAFKRMVDAVLDAGAAGADKVETQLVQNNRAVDGALKEGQTYRLRIRSEIEGNVMVVDKNESGFYDLVFPYFETDDEKIGPDKDVYLPLYAAIQEANATSEEGSLNIFVLPSSVDIRSAFLAPSKTGTKSLRPVAPESGEQLSDEIGRIADLLGLDTSDASTQQLLVRASVNVVRECYRHAFHQRNQTIQISTFAIVALQP